MREQTANKKNIFILVPFFGACIFILLYFIATQFYPGGSQADKYSKGFSWINNYWCNLLNGDAINGEHNTARPIAMSAALVLCFSLSVFWYIFPLCIHFKKNTTRLIQYSGIVSMSISLFLFTSFHDIIINIAGLLGLIAMAGTIIGLYKIRYYKLFYFGLFNLLLVILNNYFYHDNGLITYLPVVQKFSFLSFLFWFSLITLQLYFDPEVCT